MWKDIIAARLTHRNLTSDQFRSLISDCRPYLVQQLAQNMHRETLRHSQLQAERTLLSETSA